MSRLRLAAFSLASGYLAIAANAAYALASIPLALHYLSTEQFGLWVSITTVASYLVLVDLGMSGSVSRNLMDHKENKADGRYGSVIQTSLLVGLVQGAVIALGGVIVGFWFPALLRVPAGYTMIFRILVAGECLLLGLFFVGRTLMGILQAHGRFDILNYTQIFQLAAGFIAQWLTFHWGWGLYSLLAAGAVTGLCGLANNLAAVLRLRLLPPPGSWGRPSWQLFRGVFAYGNDLFLMTLGLQLLNASQIIIIARAQDLTAAAVWSIASRTFQLAFQFVGRIFDFSGTALGDMIIGGERNLLRRRFRDILMLTGSAVVFAAAGVAVCNSSFLAVWTKKVVAWPWRNDVLLGALLLLNCVGRCFLGLSGYAKELRTMRWIYFLEGATFAVAALLVAPHLGLSGIILMAILANLAWSGSYGIRWAARYLGVSVREILFEWLGPAQRYLLLLLPIAAGTWWATLSLPPIFRLVVNGGVVGAVGLALFWTSGLTPALRAELKHTLGHLRPKVRSSTVPVAAKAE